MILTESLGVNECVTNDLETSFSRNKQGKRKFQNVCMYLYLIITVRNEVSAPGGGGLLLWGALLLGVCFGGGGGADPPRREGYCSARYASYWNAFLFGNNINEFQQHFTRTDGGSRISNGQRTNLIF